MSAATDAIGLYVLSAAVMGWQCLPEIATAPLGPRNDKLLAFTVLTLACTGRQHCAGRGVPLSYNYNVLYAKKRTPAGPFQLVKKGPKGLFRQAAFRIAKSNFVALFCNSAAAAGYLTRKETLTVSFHTFLPSVTFGLTIL